MQVGVDLELDRQRFHVTEKGRVLVVPEMLGQLQVEATFPDGTKLITVTAPIS